MKLKKVLITFLFVLVFIPVTVTAQKTNNSTKDQVPETTQNYVATYLGGTGKEFCEAIAVDNKGNVYVTGYTSSANFPTTAGSYNSTYKGKADVFVTKFDRDLRTVLASAIISGSEDEVSYSILFDESGYIYLAGYTESEDFPTTTSAYSTKYKGGGGDAFILKMDKDLKTIVSSTFLGGSGKENDWRSPEIVQDKTGNIFIAGITDSKDFPATNGAFRDKYNGGSMDVFVSKFDPGLKQLLASTLIGGSKDDRMGRSLCIDSKNDEICIGGYTFSSDFPVTKNAYGKEVSGNLDGFVIKLTMDLREMTASTILNGGWIYSIMIHDNGDIYVGGHASNSLPTTSKAYYRTFDKHSDQGFISGLSNDLSELKSSTVLPGSFHYGGGAICCLNLAQSQEGDIVSAGWAGPKDFPSTPGVFDETQNGKADLFIQKMDKDLSKVLVSTFIGGSRSERWNRMTINGNGKIYIAGYTLSSDFPTTKGAAFEKFHEVITDKEQNLGTSPRDAFVIGIESEISAEVYEEFHDAAKKDDLNKVRQLLSYKEELLEKTDKYKRTALHSAARYGAAAVSGYLIETGANLNTGDENGDTPLHLASLYSQDEVVKLILKSNVDINASNVDINALNDDENTPLSLAVYYGNLKTVGLLLSNEADGSIQNNEGNSPLHLATRKSHLEKVQKLLQHGSEVNLANKAGNTALHLAVRRSDNIQFVKYLIDRGANLSVADSSGKTALHIASIPNAKLLLKRGANVNLQDGDGDTVLHKVLKFILQLLRNSQMIIGDVDEFISAQKDQVKSYMEAGADPDIKNKTGKSPMDLASESGDKEIIDLLKTKK